MMPKNREIIMKEKEFKYSYSVAKSIIAHLCGCLALPNTIEQKAIKMLSPSEEYTSKELLEILLKLCDEENFKVDPKFLLQTNKQLKRVENTLCNLDNIITCPECKSKDLFKDKKREETVCRDCGLVIEGEIKTAFRNKLKKKKNKITEIEFVPIFTVIMVGVLLPSEIPMKILVGCAFGGLIYLLTQLLIKTGIVKK